MFETKVRIYYEPDGLVTVPIIGQVPYVTAGQTWSYRNRGYTRYYEEISKQVVTKRFADIPRQDEDAHLALEALRLEESTAVQRSLKPWKPFQHYKRWVDFTSTPLATDLPVSVLRSNNPSDPLPYAYFRLKRVDHVRFGLAEEPYQTDLGTLNFGLPDFVDLSEDREELVIPPENLDELIALSVRKLVPHVKSQLSILNSLIEVKDWVTLKHTFSGISKLVSRAKARGLVGTLKESVRSAADLFLQWNFNLAPLISDIKGIHTALTASVDGIKRAMDAAGTPQVSRFRLKFVEFKDVEPIEDEVTIPYQFPREFPTSGNYGMTDWFVTALLRRRVTHSQSEFYAQLRYVATYSATQKRLASLLAVTDALGLKATPKIIWDALPWSFVIDWVAKVGPYLDRFSEAALDPVLDIFDYSWTIKRKRTVSTQVLWDMYGGPNGQFEQYTWIDLPDLLEEAYRRQPMSPDKNALILGGLTAQQFRLASALVISRRKKLKKTRPRRAGARTTGRIRRVLKHAK